MMNLAHQVNLNTPAAEAAPVSSIMRGTVFSAIRDARLRCLVQSSFGQSLPDLVGVDYELDLRADYDLILLPEGADGSAIGRLLAQATSPAPVIISRSQALGARADLVLSDWSAPSLSAAILSVKAPVTRVSELPRLPKPHRYPL